MELKPPAPADPGEQRFGPYRVIGHLGAGGMGDVFRAHDERLERDVALKVVRSDARGRSDRQERFRREARLAASLNHPAIVQVFDVLESPVGDVIVMELVEGTSLRVLAQAGELDQTALLTIAADVAAGLAHAHAHGIVHRDLKTENVMVTRAGRGKILDFGVARRVALPTDAESLSSDAVVVGTYRAMSPEQARGRPVDHRSDLFSFGVLLYECLARRSPFLAGSPAETLLRICGEAPPPLREVAPGVPHAVAELVDRLLDKDPGRRPASAVEVEIVLRAGLPTATSGESGLRREPVTDTLELHPVRRRATWSRWRMAGVAALLIAAGVGAAVFGHRWLTRSAAPVYVAVVTEAPAGSDASSRDLRMALQEAVLRTLASLEGVSPIPVAAMGPGAAEPATVAQTAAAQEVVTTTLDCSGATCRVGLSRWSPAGAVLWTQGFHAPADEPLMLAEGVEGHLRHAYPERGVRAGHRALEVRPADYAEYLAMRRAFEQKESAALSLAEMQSRLARIRESSPRFLEAHLFAAGMLRHRFEQSGDRAALAEATRLLARARELAPLDPRTLARSFELALTRDDVREAETWLEALARLEPGGTDVLVERATLEERQGRPRQAVELMEAAARQHPSVDLLFNTADVAFRAGDTTRARRHLTEALRRDAGSFRCRSMLAQVELLDGNLERAGALYSELVTIAPQVAELTNLGLVEMLRGRHADAEKAFARAAALEPENPYAALNLADSRVLQGRHADAAPVYLRVLALTSRPISTATGSPDWQLLSARAQALAHLGRVQEAVAAVQQVLVMAHENAQARFEVALTYTLVRERASALANATEAIKRGVGALWFRLAFFDELRRAPELQALLAEPR